MLIYEEIFFVAVKLKNINSAILEIFMNMSLREIIVSFYILRQIYNNRLRI